MQMDYLKDHGFETILPEALAKMVQSRQRPENQVVLTFDDGYQDNYENALPVLARHGFKATFFIITDWVGKPGFMGWEEILQIHRLGHTVGSHSIGHHFLTEIPLAQAKDEIYNSKALIEERLGFPVQFFCYPAGRFNAAIQRMVEAARYKAAFATAPGRAFSNEDLFALKRIRISESSYSPWRFWWRVAGYYLVFREITARRMK